MNSRVLRLILLIIIAFVSQTNIAKAQCDSLVKKCSRNITSEYISDGQSYKSFLQADQEAEYKLTLFEGTTYRFAGCSGSTDRNLIFTLLDLEGNLLFTNRDYDIAPYWDFEIKNTIDCKMTLSLDPKKIESGCGVVLIGFKKK